MFEKDPILQYLSTYHFSNARDLLDSATVGLVFIRLLVNLLDSAMVGLVLIKILAETIEEIGTHRLTIRPG